MTDEPPMTAERATLTAADPAESHDLGDVAAAKVRVDFQREIYRVRDGRIAAADSASGVLSTAAATVGAVASAALGDLERTGSIVVVLLLAVLSITAAAIGRRESPIPAWRRLRALLRRSQEAVAHVQELRGGDVDELEMANACFAAWHAVTNSAQAREKQKRVLHSLALTVFLLEVLFAVFAITR